MYVCGMYVFIRVHNIKVPTIYTTKDIFIHQRSNMLWLAINILPHDKIPDESS